MKQTDATPEQLEELLGILASLSAAVTEARPDQKQIIVGTSSAHLTEKEKAEARYRALIEQIPALTFTVSLEEGAPEIFVGPQIETILGFNQEEWMSDPILWFNQCHPDDRDIWHQEFARGIHRGGPFRAECRVFAKDGRTVWLHGEARLIRDDQGRPLFLQGVAFDVTEQKLAEQKLKEAQEIRVLNERLNAVGQMAASIGHDLRNPLGAIRNAWTLVQKKAATVPEMSGDKRMNDLFAIIERELGRSNTIISELLEFSRDRAPHRTMIDLRALADEVFSVVAKPNESMELLNEVPESFEKVAIDGDQMRQVLVNLVQNGLEAIAKTGHVKITAETISDEGDIVIKIIDNGKGIAPEVKDSVWKPLFTTKKRGTGLGLPIVANIIGRHDGLISFDSTVGKGTAFRLQLPKRAASEEPEPDAGGAAEVAMRG